MALFTKEPEKNPKIQPAMAPHASSMPPAPATSTSTATPRANGPAASEGRAYLDRGSKISGKISFEGPARIDGVVDGEINAKDSLMIGESAVVTAQIRAASVSVAGKVSGDIVATQRIEIRPSARVSGNITAPVLSVQEGAQFEGHCSMQPEGIREDRKVTVFPKEERVAQAAGGLKQA
ncbi:polymer-forming cytoskeletal protein [Candidatus Binatus sp.]|uniref:bactofilin family protein n=1 Tax=Candidatus Binatus sp. TaxID=2811406 RepID=UPI002F924DF7